VFPFSTASWYFLDALDMTAPANARAVVAFGDSITVAQLRLVSLEVVVIDV
jgi:hypothetical protein